MKKLGLIILISFFSQNLYAGEIDFNDLISSSESSRKGIAEQIGVKEDHIEKVRGKSEIQLIALPSESVNVQGKDLVRETSSTQEATYFDPEASFEKINSELSQIENSPEE